MDTRQTIRQYLQDKLLVEFNDTVTDDANLFKVGAIDSFGLAELVVFLETRFNIAISNDELLGGHFNSLNGMAAFVERKLQDVAV